MMEEYVRSGEEATHELQIVAIQEEGPGERIETEHPPKESKREREIQRR